MTDDDKSPAARVARCYETMQDRLTPWWRKEWAGVQLWLWSVTIAIVTLIFWRFPPNLM